MGHRSQSPETDNSQGTYNAGIVQTSSLPSNESEAENDHFCQQLCDSPEDFTVVRFILYHYFDPMTTHANFYWKHLGKTDETLQKNLMKKVKTFVRV